MFRSVAGLFTIYIYTATAAPVVVRHDVAINWTPFLPFFTDKKFARPKWDANMWEKGMTVDTNSLRYLPRRSSKNKLRTATDRFQETFCMYVLCSFARYIVFCSLSVSTSFWPMLQARHTVREGTRHHFWCTKGVRRTHYLGRLAALHKSSVKVHSCYIYSTSHMPLLIYSTIQYNKI